MAFRFFKLDREARSRVKMMLWIGLLLIVLTILLNVLDEIGFAFCCAAILAVTAFLLSEATERWLSRAHAHEASTPGRAIDLSSLERRLERLRGDHLEIQARPLAPFHEVLIASAGAAIRKKRFFLSRDTTLEEDQPQGGENRNDS